MTGLEMVQVLRDLGSKIPVIVLTNSQDELPPHDHTFIMHLPFAPKDLAKCISDILQRCVN
jgi:CheY-like chemotaxis protein